MADLSGNQKPSRPLRVERLGRVPYGPMLALQEARHAAVADGLADDTLFLLEHDPVITTGRNTGTQHVLVSQQALAARRVEFFATGRGGDVTYHGPGQLVGYPIVMLQPGEQDIRRYVRCLEDILIRTALDFGVTATRVEGLRGIWVGNDKLAAIGVRVARWTTSHGFALNVNTQLDDFNLIVPCGLYERGVTSLKKLRGAAIPMQAVEDRIAVHTAEVLGRAAIASRPTPWRASAVAHGNAPDDNARAGVNHG